MTILQYVYYFRKPNLAFNRRLHHTAGISRRKAILPLNAMMTYLKLTCVILSSIVVIYVVTFADSWKFMYFSHLEYRVQSVTTLPSTSSVANETQTFSTVTTPVPDSSVINPFPYKYLLNSADLCKQDNTDYVVTLLVLVCSNVKNFKEREAIRKTWATVRYKKKWSATVGFLLASTSDEEVMKLAGEESSKYSDVIMGDFLEAYTNLTLKSMLLLKWVKDFCPRIQFVLKTDDDMYINIPNLLSAIAGLPQKTNILFGHAFKGAKPDRNPSAKWHVPVEQFSNTTFPDYLSGTAYCMSSDAVPRLFSASLKSKFLVMEDVFVTGVCAEKAGVKRIHKAGFDYGKRPATGCAYKDAISGHHVTVSEMYTIVNDLKRTNLTCKKEQ